MKVDFGMKSIYVFFCFMFNLLSVILMLCYFKFFVKILYVFFLYVFIG